jgi:hypothetical protein
MSRARASSPLAVTRNSNNLSLASAAARSIAPCMGKLKSSAVSALLVGAIGCSSPKLAPVPAAPQSPQSETDRLIDSLVGDMHAVESAHAKAAEPAKSNALPPDADSFEADQERIRSSVSKWPHGTGATLRFLKESTGERLSLIFVDDQAPTFDPEVAGYTINAKARVSGGKIVAHFYLLLKDLHPGKYHGDDHSKGALMGVLMGDSTWDAQNPEAALSVNRESWCDVELHPASDGELEGTVRARLVDNRGAGYINVESGFLFIKR